MRRATAAFSILATCIAAFALYSQNTPPRATATDGGRVLPTPPSVTPRSPAGWTSTGGDVIDHGCLAGYVVVADDGRLTEGDGSPYARALHFVSSDFDEVVKTLTLPNPSISSTQGVAIDPRHSSNGIWVAHGSGDNHIRHYRSPSCDMNGSAEGAIEVDLSAIDWNGDLLLSSSVNGLAFDSDHGAALWASPISGSFAVQIDIDTKTIIRTIELGTSSPDQLSFISRNEMYDGQARLVYTTGNNGSPGIVRVYNLETDQDAAWAQLPGAEAIEQFFFDPVSNIGWALSDGGYHSVANPPENRVWFFEMPELPV